MERYMVTVRHIDCFTVEVEAADKDAAADAAEQQIELNPRDADWSEVDVEPELADDMRLKVIGFDENGPHDMGNLDVGELHNVIAEAVEEPQQLEAAYRMIRDIQDALGTAEKGEGLVEIARNAHRAEVAFNSQLQFPAPGAENAYAFEPHWFRKLREVEDGLHGKGRVLTGDQRRDLANLMTLILSNAVQI
jgi:hypothetical protein